VVRGSVEEMLNALSARPIGYAELSAMSAVKLVAIAAPGMHLD
jgi:hypothetical protein